MTTDAPAKPRPATARKATPPTTKTPTASVPKASSRRSTAARASAPKRTSATGAGKRPPLVPAPILEMSPPGPAWPKAVKHTIRAAAAAGIVGALVLALHAPANGAKAAATATPSAGPAAGGALTAGQADAANAIGQNAGIASATVPFTAAPGDTGSILLDVLPATVGPTELHLTVLDAKNAIEDTAGIQAVLTHEGQSGPGETVTLNQLSAGHYVSQGARLTAKGKWDLSVTLITQLGNYVTTQAALTVG